MESNDEGKNVKSDVKEYGLFDPNRRVLTDTRDLVKSVVWSDWQLDDTRGEIICNSCGLSC